MQEKHIQQEGNQIILNTQGKICSTTRELVRSDVFEWIYTRYLESLLERQSPILEGLGVDLNLSHERTKLLEVLQALAEDPIEQIHRTVEEIESYETNRNSLFKLVEGLYDYWRSFDRFMVCHSEEGPDSHDQRPYRTFNATVERLDHLIRALYRDICENITGLHPRVYRQVCAGCNVGLIAIQREWNIPSEYQSLLEGIPFIRQVLVDPPMIIYPPMNTRSGQFKRIMENSFPGMTLEKSQWMCYPAQVGPLVIFVYFPQIFISLGTALANLFELATDAQISAGPDAIYLFGAPPESLAVYGELPTVFFDDEVNNILIAGIPGENRFGYFGYVKKMVLTLHNIVMMKRGRMPYHGAMTHIQLKDGSSANILIIGDTATGKSETLEAFRSMGNEYIRELKIIADDMGSLEVSPEGKVLGYGTEIGAFVRLDDLQHGYAFGQLDRAIFMNPNKVNSRVVVPVTSLDDLLKGYPVDFILYCNNYEEVDEDHPIIDHLENMEQAIAVFREGAAMSKGTTTSTGLGHSYYANIFGPPQYKDLHEGLARKTFNAAVEAGVYIGQMRTRLGIPGYEFQGPQEAAKALFNLINQRAQK